MIAYFITGLICFTIGGVVGGFVVFMWITGGIEDAIGRAFGWR